MYQPFLQLLEAKLSEYTHFESPIDWHPNHLKQQHLAHWLGRTDQGYRFFFGSYVALRVEFFYYCMYTRADGFQLLHDLLWVCVTLASESERGRSVRNSAITRSKNCHLCERIYPFFWAWVWREFSNRKVSTNNPRGRKHVRHVLSCYSPRIRALCTSLLKGSSA